MKTKLFTCAIVLASLAISAQTTEKKQATVRIKKVENTNGVETVTDTTFTTDEASALKLGDATKIQTIDIKDGKDDGKMEHIIILHGDPINEKDDNVKIVLKGDNKDADAEIQKALKEAGVDPNMKGAHKMIIINEENGPGKDGKNEKRMTKIVMVNMDITEANADDKKRLSNQIGNADNKLEMENMKLYPNPNDGKFNLNFNLKNKADAEITVYDIQGKQVYNEKLPNFSGEYNKPIDISSNAKGIYFVKIQQGKHTQVKKISLD